MSARSMPGVTVPTLTVTLAVEPASEARNISPQHVGHGLGESRASGIVVGKVSVLGIVAGVGPLVDGNVLDDGVLYVPEVVLIVVAPGKEQRGRGKQCI